MRLQYTDLFGPAGVVQIFYTKKGKTGAKFTFMTNTKLKRNLEKRLIIIQPLSLGKYHG